MWVGASLGLGEVCVCDTTNMKMGRSVRSWCSCFFDRFKELRVEHIECGRGNTCAKHFQKLHDYKDLIASYFVHVQHTDHLVAVDSTDRMGSQA
jgi:hypothetical protein